MGTEIENFEHLLKISYQDFNLTGQTLLETGAGTDFPLRSFRVILLNLKSSLRFELMKHSHSEY